MNELTIVNSIDIQDKIFTIRGVQVILDRDLATLYQVETKVFNQAVKRNIQRFPQNFRFQLTKEELQNLRSQNVTLKENLTTRYLPYAFTEFGVSMLSAVLKSDIAIEISIKIIESFVNMRKVMSSNTLMYQRFERIENRLSVHDENFEKIFKAIEDKSVKPEQGIFYNGQIFNAYSFNQQYKKIELKQFDLSHDRFLIIDEEEVYHIGASLKDLGKKWFAFSKMDINSFEIIGKLK